MCWVVKCMLACFICVWMPFCTCSLFCGGRKGCDIWSMFQEKQLSTSPSRRMQVGLLPCFGHFIPLHRARLILQEEEGEEAGSRSWAGRCRIRGLTDSGTCMTWWGCTPKRCQEAIKRVARSTLQSLLFAVLGMQAFWRRQVGACMEASSTFYDRNSLQGEAVIFSQGMWNRFPWSCVLPSQGLSWKGLWYICVLMLLICGKGMDWKLRSFMCTAPASCRTIYFSSQACHHVVLQEYQTFQSTVMELLAKHGFQKEGFMLLFYHLCYCMWNL